MKMIHSQESKLEKATFTGACFSLGNSKAATTNVKANYTKTRNAFLIYFDAAIHAAWLQLIQNYPLFKEQLETARREGKKSFLEKFRRVF